MTDVVHSYMRWLRVFCAVISVVSAYSVEDTRRSNDISLSVDRMERLGQTDSLIKALKDIAQHSHDCGVRDVPKLRRKFLNNATVTCNDGSAAG
ncbi:hypothetical protein ACF0H5_008561 [Mactra antiquata]